MAIVDALGIIVVVVFHSDGARLAGAAAALLSVVAARRLGHRWPLAYVPLAMVAWVCALEQLEHRLHP